MEKQNLFREIAEVLAEVAECDVNEVKMDSNLLNDLGVTSLMGLEILVELEKKYGITLEEDALPLMTTPGNIILVLEEKFQENNLKKAE